MPNNSSNSFISGPLLNALSGKANPKPLGPVAPKTYNPQAGLGSVANSLIKSPNMTPMPQGQAGQQGSAYSSIVKPILSMTGGQQSPQSSYQTPAYNPTASQSYSAPQQSYQQPGYQQPAAQTWQQRAGVNVTENAPTPPGPAMNNTSAIGSNDVGFKSLLQRAIEAQNAYKNYNQGIQQGLENITDKPIALEFQTGQKAELQRNTGIQSQALASQADTATRAAQLAQPVNIFGTLTSPTSGEAINPNASGQISGNVSNLAQAVANNQIDYQSALSQLSQYGPNVQNSLLRAIQGINPGFNVNQSAGNAAALGQQGQQIAQYQSAYQQGRNLQSQLTDLITTFGLNPSDINAVNTGLQRIAQNTSSPQYQQLSNYLNDVANTYAQILTPSGGSQTDTTRAIAASMLNASASGQSIIQVMQGLDQAAQAKIAGISTAGSSYGGGGGGGQFTGSAWQ